MTRCKLLHVDYCCKDVNLHYVVLCCCRYVACMNPTAGSFVVNPRLQRLFMTLAVEFPGQESLMKIYGTFVTGHFKKFSADVQVRCILVHLSKVQPVISSCVGSDAVLPMICVWCSTVWLRYPTTEQPLHWQLDKACA